MKKTSLKSEVVSHLIEQRLIDPENVCNETIRLTKANFEEAYRRYPNSYFNSRHLLTFFYAESDITFATGSLRFFSVESRIRICYNLVKRLPTNQRNLYNALANKKIEYLIIRFGVMDKLSIIVAKSEDYLQHLDENDLLFFKSSFPKYFVVGCSRCVRDPLYTKDKRDSYLPWNSPFTVLEFLQRHNLLNLLSNQDFAFFSDSFWNQRNDSNEQ